VTGLDRVRALPETPHPDEGNQLQKEDQPQQPNAIDRTASECPPLGPSLHASGA
jgi:hypothetical protein